VLDTPDLNVPSFERLDFDQIVARGVERAAANPPDAIVGSSLGALVALAVARRGAHTPLVLIAPAIGVRDRWLELIPPGDPILAFHHADGKEWPIHRAFFERMSKIDVDDHPPSSRVTVIMGRNDDSVPFERVRERWARWESEGLVEGSKFIEIEDGDHGLTAFVDVIAEEIRRALYRSTL
jgi:pimeloyl-ACP methyl ester carboxylesterase